MDKQIEQLYKPIFLFVKKRVNSREDAEDLTQEVFYKLSKVESHKVESVKSWVYTIARNTITDYYRKKKISTTAIENLSYVEDLEQENVAAELSKCVEDYIEQLPADYRLVMRLAELEGIPQKEIAEQLNMNYVTLRSKIQRGRKKLKGLISDCCLVIQGGKGSILKYEERGTTQQDSDCCE